MRVEEDEENVRVRESMRREKVELVALSASHRKREGAQ